MRQKLCFHLAMKKYRPDIIQQVITRAGGLKNIAEPLGITRQAVSQWYEIPPTRVIDIERITGISRSILRPDIYPVDNQP